MKNGKASREQEPSEANVNFWQGCKKVSAACKNCLFFINQGSRFENFGHKPEHDPENIHRLKTTWDEPFRLQGQAESAGKNIACFVCGNSDFFLEEADAWRAEAWDVIRKTPNVIYQIQTKRTERIAAHLPPDWGSGYPNVWLGASVEQKRYFYRLDHLRAIPCVLRYADNLGMLESLMPDLETQLDGIGWCVSGGEKGCNKVDPRPWNPDWSREVRDVCQRKNIPFWFAHIAGRGQRPSNLLDGQVYRGRPPLAFATRDVMS
jgi:protein gp37